MTRDEFHRHLVISTRRRRRDTFRSNLELAVIAVFVLVPWILIAVAVGFDLV